jgi:hypothetical protein
MKPLPPALERNPELEQAAMRAIEATGINADVLMARVASPVEVVQNEATGVPTHRLVKMVVVVKSRAVENTCTWGKYLFSQRHAGGGTYAGAMRKEGVYDTGSVDCNSPELTGGASAPAAAQPAAEPGAGPAPPPAADPAVSDSSIEETLSQLGSDVPDSCKRYAEKACRAPNVPEANRAQMCQAQVQVVKHLMETSPDKADIACESMANQ